MKTHISISEDMAYFYVRIGEQTTRYFHKKSGSWFDSTQIEYDLMDAVRAKVMGTYYSKPYTLWYWKDELTTEKRFDEDYKFSHRLKRLPECARLIGRYKLAATDSSVKELVEISDEFVFEDEDAESLFTMLALRIKSQTTSALKVAEFRLSNFSKYVQPEQHLEHPENPLSGYQKVGLTCATEQPGYALFMEQGTGKTPIAINLICNEAYKKNSMYRVLVICPQQVRMNWEEEFEKFATVGGKTSILRGGKHRRINAILDGVREEEGCLWGACIASYDVVESTIEAMGMVPWDIVILDESHYIKSKNTNRFKAIINLRDIAGRRLILTGTPIGNTPIDLWSQLEFLYEGGSGFTAYEKFRRFYGVWEVGGKGFEKFIRVANTTKLKERLARMSFIIKKDEVLDLPEKIYDSWEIEMTAKQKRIYNSLAESLIAEIESDLENETTITANHILTKMLRLAQVTSGHVKTDTTWTDEENCNPGVVMQIDPDNNPKVKAILEILEDMSIQDPNAKCIVWCSFIEDMRILAEVLCKNGIKFAAYHKVCGDAKNIDDAKNKFNNDPECRVFIGNPASGSTGLNLVGYNLKDPDNSSTYTGRVIYFSQNWSLIQRQQSEDRAHRRGMKGQVQYTNLVVPGSIDQEIRDRVSSKKKVADDIQSVRDILNKLKEGLE